MPDTVIMMSNTQEVANLTGQSCKADGWYGHTEGLHTIVMNVINFTGRIFIEASLAMTPTDDDWFELDLSHHGFHSHHDDQDCGCDHSHNHGNYIQFPRNPNVPTGSQETGGDTGSFGFTFRINALWLRARLDRTYLDPALYDLDPNSLQALGYVNKITLAR